MNGRQASRNIQFAHGLARAFAGAILFGLPLLMTMEMWWLGFYLHPAKLAAMLVLLFPVLVLLSWHAGFEPTFSWKNDVVDALVAYLVGFASAAAVLGLLGLVEATMAPREIVGKIALQAVPGSIGALLAQSQIGVDKAKGGEHGSAGDASEFFIMAVGAVFFALNVAPTEEMLVIALRITAWQALLVVAVSVALMQAFMYAEARSQQPAGPLNRHAVVRFTVTGYGLALVLSAGMLWFFGRMDHVGADMAVKAVVVLALPAGIGAASARLVL